LPLEKNKSNLTIKTKNKMTLKLTLIVLIISFTVSSCNSQDCKELPSSFDSYKHALSEVKSTDFKLEDSVNTSRSSVIESANFFSCDGNNGYLIIEIRNTEYIYQNVPIAVWESFKNVDSFGRFYNRKINGSYKLNRIHNEYFF
jgi:hypothetical protein